jgi:hypothetical protein
MLCGWNGRHGGWCKVSKRVLERWRVVAEFKECSVMLQLGLTNTCPSCLPESIHSSYAPLLEIIVASTTEPARIHQYRPIHQRSAGNRHPACRRLDQLGMRERQAGSLLSACLEITHDEHAREEAAKVGVRPAVSAVPGPTHELYSGETSSAPAHLEQIEFGSGASTNVRAAFSFARVLSTHLRAEVANCSRAHTRG